MGEVVVGILAVLFGALFALQGGNIMRVVFPLFGFVTGFSTGAAALSGVTGDSFLGTFMAWVVGLGVALLFAALAYFYYAFAVVLVFAGFGFSLGAAVLSLFNIEWNWLAVSLGVITATMFGIIAVAGSLPMKLLIVVTSFFGASMIIYGLLLLLDIVGFGDFSSGQVYEEIKSSAGLYILWLTIGVGASITQLKALGERIKLARDYWYSSMQFDELVVNDKKSRTKPKATK